MYFIGKLFSGGEKLTKQEETETLSDREELLMKKREFLRKKVDQEFLFAKNNSRKNRRAALQALRRKKWYEKHLKYIDCAVKAMKSAHAHLEIVNKLNDVMKNITEEPDLTQDISETLLSSAGFEVEFDEDELLAELQRLEMSVDESVLNKDKTEKRLSSTASPSQPAMTEEEDIEGDLERLRSWASAPS
ncbi:hypothetical protein PBY51_012469 [Eleginops maclovinus]|uniref:Charged multivesicular body protein 4b n=1 Tax=Eleginops maclovinus TaxID=56733 RepID=A0AAN7XXR0_ELEMC|nr:hypothetical protein PBY51_012469 [Eleginops maclovinus]